MNSIAEIKCSLHQYIAQTDDASILSKVKDYLKSLVEKDDEVVVYTAEGEGLTRSGYKKSIDASIAKAANDGVISQEEMERDL